MKKSARIVSNRGINTCYTNRKVKTFRIKKIYKYGEGVQTWQDDLLHIILMLSVLIKEFQKFQPICKRGDGYINWSYSCSILIHFQRLFFKKGLWLVFSCRLMVQFDWKININN